MYFVHVVFCYLIFISGILAMVTRLVPAFKWTHAWFGRAYIISMLWATASSLVIHNTGLPASTLISFIWALGGELMTQTKDQIQQQNGHITAFRC